MMQKFNCGCGCNRGGSHISIHTTNDSGNCSCTNRTNNGCYTTMRNLNCSCQRNDSCQERKCRDQYYRCMYYANNGYNTSNDCNWMNRCACTNNYTCTRDTSCDCGCEN